MSSGDVSHRAQPVAAEPGSEPRRPDPHSVHDAAVVRADSVRDPKLSRWLPRIKHTTSQCSSGVWRGAWHVVQVNGKAAGGGWVGTRAEPKGAEKRDL